MCLPITLCCFFSSKYKLAFFQMLLSHWSIKIWLISPPYLRGLLNTFPKWYDTWNSDENWAFYGQKTEELCFCQKFWKNFRGLFGALKLEIFLKKRYFGVTLDRHYLILRSKSKSKKLTAHLLFFGPLMFMQMTLKIIKFKQNLNIMSAGHDKDSFSSWIVSARTMDRCPWGCV